VPTARPSARAALSGKRRVIAIIIWMSEITIHSSQTGLVETDTDVINRAEVGGKIDYGADMTVILTPRISF
jgi:hypothetical protein